MSSILAGLDNEILLEQRTYKLWESAGHKIMEAQLTADQIKQLFANIEQGATDAGGNRTMIGKGKDAAGAVSKAWEDLKGKVYNSGPMNNFAAAYDKQAEKLKQATGGDQGVFKYVQKYRDFAEKHPIIQGFVYSALIAAAGVTGAGLGGAAVLGLFKLTDQLLQGKDIRSAIYQGAKTGALAYGASKLGDLIRGDKAPGTGGGDAASAAAGNLGPREVAKGAFDIVKDKIQKGEVTDWNSYQQAVNSALEQAAVQGGKEASRMSQDIARKTLDMYLNRYALDASGTFSGSGPEKIEKIITALGGQVDAEKMAMAHRAVAAMKGANESVELNEATIKILFSKVSLEHSKRIDEGIMDTLKGVAGKAMDYAKTKGHNLTTKVTADKLNTAWEKAGKPTDSDKIAEILKSSGVPEDVMNAVFTKMKIPTTPAPTQQPAQQGQQTSTQQPAQPAAQEPAQAAPAAKSGKPVIKQPSVANNRTAGVRQQGGTFTYNPLAEDAEKLAQLESAMKQAQQITRAIKYDDSTTEIIVKIQELAQRTGIDPRSVKYAINDVYEAKSALESAVYGLDELFKDAYQEAKWKHDDEEEGISEEENKPKTAKALIYQTDMYGAKGYYAECKEPGCDHKTKTYDRAVQAQNAIKKHHQEHFKNVGEGYRAGASGGSGLGIEKSPMEKVLEKPLGEMEELDEYDYTKRKPYAPVTHGDTERDLVYMDRILNTLPKGLSIEEVYRAVRQKFDKMNKDLSIEQQVNAWKNIKPFIWRTYTNTWNLKEDAMADQFYDEFLHSSFKPDTPSYLDNLKGIKSFLMAKRLPDDKAKFLLRRLIQKIKPEMESAIMKGLQTEVLKHDASK